MSTLSSRSLRWIAPVLVGGVVAAGVAVPRLADASDAAAELPPRTAAELLRAVADAEVEGLSGTVVATSRLGLPELPSGNGRSEGGSAVSLPGLLAGSTTARVWKAGDDRSRLAVDAPFAEYDVVRDGADVWTFDSASSDVTHLVLPEGQEPPVEGTTTPLDAAERLLSFVEPSTQVSVGTSAMVADRAAYELVLDPRDPGTLVDTVRIAVDGETDVPLRVQVFGVGQVEPAFEVGFTSVRFAVPDASVFAFSPPPGSSVTERSIEPRSGGAAPKPEGSATTGGSMPRVLGEGWTSVVALEGVTLPEQAAGLVGQLATPVEGGRVVTSALVTVLLLDDGRVLAGAVPADRLVQHAR
jgi:outer membrane lipoprotein-sorting protein